MLMLIIWIIIEEHHKLEFTNYIYSKKDNTYIIANNDNDFIQYTFKKNYELIISTNGDAIRGKWDILTQTKILVESTNETIIKQKNEFLHYSQRSRDWRMEW